MTIVSHSYTYAQRGRFEPLSLRLIFCLRYSLTVPRIGIGNDICLLLGMATVANAGALQGMRWAEQMFAAENLGAQQDEIDDLLWSMWYLSENGPSLTIPGLQPEAGGEVAGNSSAPYSSGTSSGSNSTMSNATFIGGSSSSSTYSMNLLEAYTGVAPCNDAYLCDDSSKQYISGLVAKASTAIPGITWLGFMLRRPGSHQPGVNPTFPTWADTRLPSQGQPPSPIERPRVPSDWTPDRIPEPPFNPDAPELPRVGPYPDVPEVPVTPVPPSPPGPVTDRPEPVSEGKPGPVTQGEPVSAQPPVTDEPDPVTEDGQKPVSQAGPVSQPPVTDEPKPVTDGDLEPVSPVTDQPDPVTDNGQEPVSRAGPMSPPVTDQPAPVTGDPEPPVTGQPDPVTGVEQPPVSQAGPISQPPVTDPPEPVTDGGPEPQPVTDQPDPLSDPKPDPPSPVTGQPVTQPNPEPERARPVTTPPGILKPSRPSAPIPKVTTGRQPVYDPKKRYRTNIYNAETGQLEPKQYKFKPMHERTAFQDGNPFQKRAMQLSKMDYKPFELMDVDDRPTNIIHWFRWDQMQMTVSAIAFAPDYPDRGSMG